MLSLKNFCFLPVILLFSGFASGQNQAPPSVSEIVRINETNAFFLDENGRVGVAKFDENLNLSAWDIYSNFHWEEARSLAVGRNLSVVSGSANELSQGFDTDSDGKLDFFQDMITQWPGKDEGATISCGPVSDNHGRLLFAVAPQEKEGGDQSSKVPSTLFSWNPGGKELTVLATSSLPIAEMCVSNTGKLAAWLQLPSYGEGYFLALTELPPFDPANPDTQPIDPPSLLPQIIIPAELTDFKPIGQLCMTTENGVEKIFITCPQSQRLVEVDPQKTDSGWGGLVTVREKFDFPIYSIETMDEGRVLIGGTKGFVALGDISDKFRFKDIRVNSDSVGIDFTAPVDRAKATKEGAGVQLAIIPLEGEIEDFDPPLPVVESDGLSVVLELPELPSQAILKIDAAGVTDEDGNKLVLPTLFYTVKQ